MKYRRALPLLPILSIGLTPWAASAQELTVSGQIRPRYEFTDPAAVSGPSESFTTMRVRLALLARLERGLTIFVQPQDVRMWGEETSPVRDFSANGLDLHQAWIRLHGETLSWLTTTIGRMEVSLGGQRLVGAIDWLQQGQAFDGLRFDIDVGKATVRALAYTVNDAAAAGIVDDRGLHGAYATMPEVGPGSLDLYWLYDRLRGTTSSNEHLLGARYVLDGRITGRAEATLATGTRADADVSAFLLGLRAGTTFADGRLSVTLWYDYLSGDDPATPEIEVFNTFYGTNHKYYGLADLFTNIPLHTGGAGLQDIAAKLQWKPAEAITAGLDLHSFRAANDASLSGAHFGDELDLWFGHRYSTSLEISAGLNYFIQDQAMSDIGRLDENFTAFYIMLNATF